MLLTSKTFLIHIHTKSPCGVVNILIVFIVFVDPSKRSTWLSQFMKKDEMMCFSLQNWIVFFCCLLRISLCYFNIRFSLSEFSLNDYLLAVCASTFHSTGPMCWKLPLQNRTVVILVSTAIIGARIGSAPGHKIFILSGPWRLNAQQLGEVSWSLVCAACCHAAIWHWYLLLCSDILFFWFSMLLSIPFFKSGIDKSTEWSTMAPSTNDWERISAESSLMPLPSLRRVKDVRVFRYNLPPALLAEWPGPFYVPLR